MNQPKRVQKELKLLQNQQEEVFLGKRKRNKKQIEEETIINTKSVAKRPSWDDQKNMVEETKEKLIQKNYQNDNSEDENESEIESEIEGGESSEYSASEDHQNQQDPHHVFPPSLEEAQTVCKNKKTINKLLANISNSHQREDYFLLIRESDFFAAPTYEKFVEKKKFDPNTCKAVTQVDLRGFYTNKKKIFGEIVHDYVTNWKAKKRKNRKRYKKANSVQIIDPVNTFFRSLLHPSITFEIGTLMCKALQRGFKGFQSNLDQTILFGIDTHCVELAKFLNFNEKIQYLTAHVPQCLKPFVVGKICDVKKLSQYEQQTFYNVLQEDYSETGGDLGGYVPQFCVPYLKNTFSLCKLNQFKGIKAELLFYICKVIDKKGEKIDQVLQSQITMEQIASFCSKYFEFSKDYSATLVNCGLKNFSQLNMLKQLRPKKNAIEGLKYFKDLPINQFSQIARFTCHERWNAIIEYLKQNIPSVDSEQLKIIMKFFDAPNWNEGCLNQNISLDQNLKNLEGNHTWNKLANQNQCYQRLLTILKESGKKEIKGKIYEIVQKGFTEIHRSAQIITAIPWQVQFSSQIYHILDSGASCLVNLATGHGKTVILIALAFAYASENPDKIACIVFLNGFLQRYAQTTFSQKASNFIGVNVKFATVKTFSYIKADVYFFDEIDKMFGRDSIWIEKEDELHTLRYLPSQVIDLQQFIAISGTLNTDLIAAMKFQFPALNISLAGTQNIILRQEENKITKIVKADEPLKSTIKRIDELIDKGTVSIIVIVENQTEVESLVKALKVKDGMYRGLDFQEYFEFDNKPTSIMKNLLNLQNMDKYLILVTREGGRGVDFKAKTTAHVIICLEEINYAELVQCLGRGSRFQEAIVEGTLIQKDPLNQTGDDLLKTLQVLENHQYGNIKMNHVIAKRFADSEFKEDRDQYFSQGQNDRTEIFGAVHQFVDKFKKLESFDPSSSEDVKLYQTLQNYNTSLPSTIRKLIQEVLRE